MLHIISNNLRLNQRVEDPIYVALHVERSDILTVSQHNVDNIPS